MKVAVIVVGTMPILLVYPFLQKHFAKGVLLGVRFDKGIKNERRKFYEEQEYFDSKKRDIAGLTCLAASSSGNSTVTEQSGEQPTAEAKEKPFPISIMMQALIRSCPGMTARTCRNCRSTPIPISVSNLYRIARIRIR